MSELDVQRQSATGTPNATITKFGLGATARQIAASNDQRRTLRLSNEGSTTVWLGESDMAPGASALNFGSLTSGSNTEIEHYSGEVYAWPGGGASLAPVWLGVADIG